MWVGFASLASLWFGVWFAGPVLYADFRLNLFNTFTLIAAAQAAGLADTLATTKNITVFAPTDEAFAKLPAGSVDDLLKPDNRQQLRAILKYHVVPGRYTVKDVKYLYGAITAQGQRVLVRHTPERVTVDNASIVRGDIPASNGLIHGIDHVILPQKPVLSER